MRKPGVQYLPSYIYPYFLFPLSYFLSPPSYFLSPPSYFLSPLSYFLSPLSYFLSPISPQQRPNHPIPRNTIHQRPAGTTEACGKGNITGQLIKMTGNRCRVGR